MVGGWGGGQPIACFSPCGLSKHGAFWARMKCVAQWEQGRGTLGGGAQAGYYDCLA